MYRLNYTGNVEELNRIDFGVLSAKHILKLSVCEISSKSLTGSNSLYDPKMGSLDGQPCITCGETDLCPGHFGHINLTEPVIHPLMYRFVINILKCFCFKCGKLSVPLKLLELHNIEKYTKRKRFDYIVKLVSSHRKLCEECKYVKPKIVLNISENIIQAKWVIEKKEIVEHMTDVKILAIFKRIKEADVKILGFDTNRFHPTSLILTRLLVLPPSCRPYIMADGHPFDDDLTLQYLDIVKCTLQLKKPLDEKKRTKYLNAIRFRIHSLMDNSHEKAKHTNGRPMKCIKKRISGKEGQVRSNLMGKRVDKSGRSVIGPDPTLKVNTIAIPRRIANNLTFPEIAYSQNIESLQKLVNTNRAKIVVRRGRKIKLKYALWKFGTRLLCDDIIIRGEGEIDPTQCIIKDGWCVCTDGTRIRAIKVTNDNTPVLSPGDRVIRNFQFIRVEYKEKREFKLMLGDVVERYLRTGDYVLLNRQPTLHKGSMLAKKIVVQDDEMTIRMNLATTSTFNADFDGDEMNIHVPASYTSLAELKLLSETRQNLISPQSSKPNIKIVQDALLSVYLMSTDKLRLKKHQWCDLMMHLDADTVSKKQKQIGDVYWSHQLISMFLPFDFDFNYKGVVIENGIYQRGSISKQHLTSSHNCIIRLLCKEYGENVCAEFINNIQFVANSYLMIRGFTIGISDCVVKRKKQIKRAISKCIIEADMASQNTTHPLIREMKVSAALSRARDLGMKIAKESLNDSNNFTKTVESGSKGNFFNIAQIVGLLGQQNLKGKRIFPLLNNKTRTLPHYRFNIKNQKMMYRSHGFITRSFSQGLSPRDYFFHAMTGREGVTDTAVRTATSGYIQRKMVKLMEELKVCNDYTVRNSQDTIVQLRYGTDCMNPSKTLIKNEKPHFIDVKRVISKLNKN